MKNRKPILTQIAKSVAETALKRNANQTTCSIVYQPKVPVDLQRFRNK